MGTRAARWLVIASLSGTALAAHAAAPVAARPAQDDYTVLRLLVTDEQGRLLLEHNRSGWMTPAVRANRKQSIQEALRQLSADLGLQVSPMKLAAIYSYRFNEDPPDPAHDAVSFRQHYRAELRRAAPGQERGKGVPVGDPRRGRRTDRHAGPAHGNPAGARPSWNAVGRRLRVVVQGR